MCFQHSAYICYSNFLKVLAAFSLSFTTIFPTALLCVCVFSQQAVTIRIICPSSLAGSMKENIVYQTKIVKVHKWRTKEQVVGLKKLCTADKQYLKSPVTKMGTNPANTSLNPMMNLHHWKWFQWKDCHFLREGNGKKIQM